MRTESTTVGQLLRIFCAALMLSLGFAHKPVQAIAGPSAAYDDSYRLPDGTFAEICADHSGSELTGHRGGGHSGDPVLFCEACLLASSILVPVPDDNSWLKTSGASLENSPVPDTQTVSANSFYRPNARAPPIGTV
ncbi:hypothetical protein G6L28_06975 [Agrobacterium larrymoorei]|uniref:hypothetical protein n=1 Tax=Agrobacterium larrymoorei TaxID=160699 RepID=UPI00157443C5|nr:hypothetical protein [Agrobacterium larrymoorei]NTJ42343.1 hypothetical protein [Agrobacterium larrymoorei]